MKIRFITILIPILVSGCVYKQVEYPDLNLDSWEPISTEVNTNSHINTIETEQTITPQEIEFTAQEQAWIAKQQLHVKQQLKDPGSAQFKEMKIIYIEGAPIVIGLVNAKNSYAGYTGFRRFVAANDLIAIDGDNMDTVEMNDLMDRVLAVGTLKE